MPNPLADLFALPPSSRRAQQIAQHVLSWQGWDAVDRSGLLASIERAMAPASPAEAKEPPEAVSDRELELVFGRLAQLQSESPVAWSAESIDLVGRIYRSIAPDSPARNQILALLAAVGTTESMRNWMTALCKDPPEFRATIPLAFSPLFRRPEVLTPDFSNPCWRVRSSICRWRPQYWIWPIFPFAKDR